MYRPNGANPYKKRTIVPSHHTYMQGGDVDIFVKVLGHLQIFISNHLYLPSNNKLCGDKNSIIFGGAKVT